jgi:hypothetical protein
VEQLGVLLCSWQAPVSLPEHLSVSIRSAFNPARFFGANVFDRLRAMMQKRKV